MENLANQVQQVKGNGKLHAIYLVIIAILLGLYIFKAKELRTVVVTKEVEIEKGIKVADEIENDLKELKEKYADLQSSDVALNEQLVLKRAYIDSLLVQAAKHRGDKFIIGKLKKETETLRTIMKGYIVTIDSLNQLNGKLIADKKKVLGQLDDEKALTKLAEGEKDKLKVRIDRAAVLSTLNIKSTGIKFSRGGKKDTETLKASKVDKIRVTFDVGDNDLTIAGLHPIYIRIITPDARELTQERSPANQFSFGGTSAYFAAKKTIDYQNQPMSVLVLCPKAKAEDEFGTGKYIIEIYSDNVMIGNTTLTLD